MLSTEYTKKIYEEDSMISYYQNLTKEIKLLQSEKEILKKYFLKGFNILDIGCGTGRTTIGLKEMGYDNLKGIDISDKMIKKAQDNYKGIDYYQMDVTNLEFEESNFDGAFFSFNGMMLIPTLDLRKRAFREIHRVLKTGGIFIFSTPYLDNKLNKKFWKERLKTTNLDIESPEFGDVFLEDVGIEDIYIHIPLKKEIMECIDEAGFKLVSSIERLNVCIEKSKIEEVLDDNLYWVIQKKGN